MYSHILKKACNILQVSIFMLKFNCNQDCFVLDTIKSTCVCKSVLLCYNLNGIRKVVHDYKKDLQVYCRSFFLCYNLVVIKIVSIVHRDEKRLASLQQVFFFYHFLIVLLLAKSLPIVFIKPSLKQLGCNIHCKRNNNCD